MPVNIPVKPTVDEQARLGHVQQTAAQTNASYGSQLIGQQYAQLHPAPHAVAEHAVQKVHADDERSPIAPAAVSVAAHQASQHPAHAPSVTQTAPPHTVAATTPEPIPASLRDYRHAEHPLHGTYQDTLKHVHTMEDRGGLAHGPHSERVAAAFTAKMYDERIHHLSHIEVQGQGAKTKLVATELTREAWVPKRDITLSADHATTRSVEQVAHGWSKEAMPHLYEPAKPTQSTRDHGPPGLDNPRNADNPQHALYNRLKGRIPDASENRLLQFTAACHQSKITDKNLGAIHFDQVCGEISFGATGLTGHIASVNVKIPSPEPQQSIQHIQQTNQHQAQVMVQVNASIAQNNAQGQQGPMPGGPAMGR